MTRGPRSSVTVLALLLLLPVAVRAQECIPAPVGLVSWWPGDGDTDDVRGGNDGTLEDGATFAAGQVDQAFSLDGAGDHVAITATPDLDIVGDVTVDLWAKRDTLGVTQTLVAKGAGGINGVDVPTTYFIDFVTFGFPNRLRAGFELANGANRTIFAPNPIADTDFHHYAYVRGGNTHKLYVDGQEVASGTFTGSPGSTASIDLTIGSLCNTALPACSATTQIAFLDGLIDEVEIFKRALSPLEIKAIYDAGSAGKCKTAVRDHLQCYQIKGGLKLKGTMDIETPQFGLEPGCKITRPAFFCAPATKSNVDVEHRQTGDPITPLALSGLGAPGDRVCWKVKCPQPYPDDQVVTDQFGTQTVENFKMRLLCTPAVKGTEYCGDGVIAGTEECEPTDDGACPGLCQADCSCSLLPLGCGSGFLDGNEACEGLDLGGATCASLGFAGGTLACSAGCGFDMSGCLPFALPATGQTTCWNSTGTVISCAGTGQDGEIQAGTTLAYVDNGDGTITDLNTGLMWEKNSDDGSIHDWENEYRWSNAFAVKIATLNSTAFAGYTDWRLPNLKELRSIVDHERVGPAIAPVFHTGCTAGCTVTTCSCTRGTIVVPGRYWSSTTGVSPTTAWVMRFPHGENAIFGKGATTKLLVRAVRGGL